MPARRTEQLDSWLLVAATAVLVLAAERYFQDQRAPRSAPSRFQRADKALAARQRGLRFPTPIRIPWPGWKTIMWRTYQRLDEDRLLATAGGVVFFGLLAIFPAITALVSFYGLFTDPSTISANLQTLAMLLPDGTFQIISDQVARVLAKGNAELGTAFLFGLLLAVWSAHAGVKAIIDALNVAYEARETRSFIRLNLVSLTFTITGIAALLVMIGAVVAFPLALDHLGLTTDAKVIISIARWPLLLAVLLTMLALLYRYGPNHEAPRWQWLSVGAVTAALLWIAGSALLSWYLSKFGDYNATYGSLGAAIGLMTWMWMSATIILLGAELNSETERQSRSSHPTKKLSPGWPDVSPTEATIPPNQQ